MKYGNVQLSYRPGSLVYLTTKSMAIDHYPNTNTSDQTHMGRSATRIMCTLIVNSEAQRRTIEQLFHSDQEAELVIAKDGRYYKRVVTGGEPQQREIRSGVAWDFTVEFIALDPVPYAIDTDEPLW